jgi:hypothetical protein
MVREDLETSNLVLFDFQAHLISENKEVSAPFAPRMSYVV